MQLEKKDREIAAAREEAQKQEQLLREQLAAAEDRARAEARKSADDEYALKLREKDKQLADAMQKVKEAEAKMQQGSQQTQGEVLELEMEEILREAFRDDEISEVKKGQHGADIAEKVIDRKGRTAATILWETKNGNGGNLARQTARRSARGQGADRRAGRGQPAGRYRDVCSTATASGSSGAAMSETSLPCCVTA